MIEQTLRTFCESRYRLIIVIAGTLVIGLVTVLPLVDVYIAEREEKTAMSAELESAHVVVAMSEQIESRTAERTSQLATIEARTVGVETLPALRTRLVELARDTGCSLRRVNVGATSTRPWREGDDAIATHTETNPQQPPVPTGFLLEWRPVTVSVSGSNASLLTLLERMEADGMLMHTKNFEIHPAGVNRKMLNLDLELWYFNLERGATT